ncbi:MAG: AAA family ATPase [Patescibacteria group bacterium]|jgi:dephospho-CoA kinase
MTKIILGFTGPMASGKGICKKYLEEKYGAKGFRFSTIMREILERLNLEINRLNMVNISTCLRQTFGEDLFAKTMAGDIKNSNEKLIVVEGIRRLADIEYLKKIPGFHLISVDADIKIRHERLVERNENVGDTEKTLEQFTRDHLEMETEISIPSVMAEAELNLNNDGSLDELHKQIDLIMAKLNK